MYVQYHGIVTGKAAAKDEYPLPILTIFTLWLLAIWETILTCTIPPAVHLNTLTWAKQLCTAVASLHKHHIAHLDIKLDNIVVDETGILMLVDYSIARVIPKENPLIEAAIGTRGLDSSGGGVLLRQSQKEALLPVPSGHLGHWGCAGVEGRGV